MSNIVERKIRERLQERDITISEFAKRLGVSRVTMYHLFQGIYSQKLIRKVAKTLQIPLHIFFMEEGGPEESLNTQVIRSYHTVPPRIRSAVNTLLNIKAPEQEPKSRPVVLVVDDIQDNVDLWKRALRKDFSVLEFTDPSAALEAMKTQTVDAVITDQRMPKMTGTQLLSAVNSMEKNIIKFIVSAYSDNQALVDAINTVHADGFFVKPFPPQELHDRLTTLLSQRWPKAEDSAFFQEPQYQ